VLLQVGRQLADAHAVDARRALVAPDLLQRFPQIVTLDNSFHRRPTSRRAFEASKSLTNDEVYAVTAHILRLNGIIGDNDVMDAKTLPQVKMPNRDGFVNLFPNKY
jgi:hypothetical protein